MTRCKQHPGRVATWRVGVPRSGDKVVDLVLVCDDCASVFDAAGFYLNKMKRKS